MHPSKAGRIIHRSRDRFIPGPLEVAHYQIEGKNRGVARSNNSPTANFEQYIPANRNNS
jgi:hypothetical protein